MNDQPHSHTITYRVGLGGRMDYGDQYDYLHLFHDEGPPWWWPRWYLNWKTKRLIRQLIQRHDEASQPVIRNPVTRMGAVRSLIGEAQEGLAEREWGSSHMGG